MGTSRANRFAILAFVVVNAALFSAAGQDQRQFGGSYSALDARRQALVVDWLARFVEATGRRIEPAEFYDQVIRVSTRTTFEAITHALITTPLSDAAGTTLGDALGLVEHVDGVKGKVLDAPGDRQFRMYARLKEGALDTLSRSRQFKRGADNTIYHQGYPINFRGRGGAPSIQISIAEDRRRADIDVDYRSASIPAALFNGHLRSTNSDVTSGNNYDRHTGRWTGLQNWWRGYFGLSLTDRDDAPDSDPGQRGAPRIGDKPVPAMAADFLEAWLVDGDIRNALNYIAPRAYACLADGADDPGQFDPGMAPFVLARRLKLAKDLVGSRASLDDLLVGIRLTRHGLRLVEQPRHAQFVVYQVPDDVAARFECEGRGPAPTPAPVKGDSNYFGVAFYVRGKGSPMPLALLWARDAGYWRIVAWQTEPEPDAAAIAPPAPAVDTAPRIDADAGFADAARGFLESWLLRKDYDTAFGYLSPVAYPCYELVRGADQPAAGSPDDAARHLRTALARVGGAVGSPRSLHDVIEAVEPVHPAIRVMNHRDSGTFTLSSVPTAIAIAADCAARAGGDAVPRDNRTAGDQASGLSLRFRTRGGEAPALRMLWAREDGRWRIVVYDVEIP